LRWYSALEPLPGVHVDGKFTLGENIGDLGGVNAAYDGLQLYLKENKSRTYRWVHPEQRFFISWTTVWRTNHVTKRLKSSKTDPFSPWYVPTQNVDAFIRHLTLKGDGMYIEPDKELRSGSS
jgi:endothelin-converting enzyme/putative endopeptidase